MTGKQPQAISGWQRSVSVLLPAFNEVDNLEPTVRRLLEALTVTVEDYEILIVDDGSTDGTDAVADRLAAANGAIRVFHHDHNMGLGYCYAEGYRQATKESFVYIPGDNSWPYRSFVELFGNMGRADIVTSYAINPEVRPRSRRFVSELYTNVLNILFNRHLRYFNGLTIYPVSFLRLEPATTFGFGFQAEVLLKALQLGLSYIEVGLPIDERMAGKSKAVSPRNILSVLTTLLRLIYEIRICHRWGPGSWSANQSLPLHAATALEELGFDPAAGSGPELQKESTRTSIVVVVAGASSGIGAAVAKDLAAAGHKVMACSRNAERLQATFADTISVQYMPCDMADEDSVKRFVEFVGNRVEHVDALINCAGSFGAIGPIDRIESQAWRRTVEDNLFATFLSIKHFLPLLERSSAASIINMSGGGAFSPFPNFSAYACSKAAIVRLTETLAIELAPRGISVNAVAPGLVPTPVHEATIAAGPERAGTVQYNRTRQLMQSAHEISNAARLKTVQDCVRALLSLPYRNLTGKTISANFDPWSSESFHEQIPGITRSELYTMRRTNISNLPEGLLRTNLMQLWARHRTDR